MSDEVVVRVRRRRTDAVYAVLVSWHPSFTGSVRVRVAGVQLTFAREGRRFVSGLGWSVSLSAVQQAIRKARSDHG